MPKFRCNVCQAQVDGMLFRCPQCNAIGKGFTEVSDDAPAPADSTPTSSAPTPAPTPKPPAPTPAPPASAPAAPPATTPAAEPVEPPPSAPNEPDQLAWRYPADAASRIKGPVRGCPAIGGDGRMFLCLHHELLAFSPGSSVPDWCYETGAPIPRSPAIGPDGNVRVHSSDGYLHVVDPNGLRLFEPVLVGEALGWASPLVDDQNNTWICRQEGGLARIDAAGQTERRPFFRTRRRFDCTGVILGETLFIGCEDHYLHAISLTGSRGESLWDDATELGRTSCPIHCPIAVGNRQELLVASQDDRLYSFTTDGQLRWSLPLHGLMLSSPVVGDDGTIYAGVVQNVRDRNPRGVLVAINSTSHQVKWQYQANGPIECTPVLGDDGVIYFGDNNGTVHALDPGGKSLWTAQLSAPVRSAGTLTHDGLLAFCLDDGSLVALSCSSRQLASQGWPKLLGGRGQSGLVGGPP